MSYTEEDILLEIGDYFVLPALFGTGRFKPKSEGLQVWKNGATHATIAAHIGHTGEEGIEQARQFIESAIAGKAKAA